MYTTFIICCGTPYLRPTLCDLSCLACIARRSAVLRRRGKERVLKLRYVRFSSRNAVRTRMVPLNVNTITWESVGVIVVNAYIRTYIHIFVLIQYFLNKIPR